jgi:hypothetical protein
MPSGPEQLVVQGVVVHLLARRLAQRPVVRHLQEHIDEAMERRISGRLFQPAHDLVGELGLPGLGPRDPRSVCQEVVDVHGVAAVADELGKVLAHRTGQPDASLLDQHHDRSRGDRLGDRREWEEGVDRERGVVGLGPETAERLVQRDHTAARDDRDDRGMDSVLHPLGGEIAGVRETARRQAGFPCRSFPQSRHRGPSRRSQR